MKQDKDFSILVADKNFQRILSEWTGFSEKEKADICKEYKLTLQDVGVLHQIWLGLDFCYPEFPSAKIETALGETIWKIAERGNAVIGKSPFRIIYEQFARVAAILIIPLILYAGYTHFQNSNSVTKNMDSQTVMVNSQSGTITKLVLPDGTKVCLNAGSTISYPNYFMGKERKVSLSGEAYFDVVKNKKAPMVVSAGNVNLKVYGTSFNVNAYPDEESTKITLVEGSVSLSSSRGKFNGKDEFFMKPGQTVTFDNNSKKLEVENKDTFQFTAWKDGLLVFKNTSFESVLKLLSRRFNIDIDLVSKNLAPIPMDATFRNENIDEILRLLSLGTPFKYYYGHQPKLADGTFEKSRIYIENK